MSVIRHRTKNEYYVHQAYLRHFTTRIRKKRQLNCLDKTTMTSFLTSSNNVACEPAHPVDDTQGRTDAC